MFGNVEMSRLRASPSARHDRHGTIVHRELCIVNCLSPRVERSGIEGSRRCLAHTLLKTKHVPSRIGPASSAPAVRSHPRRRTAIHFRPSLAAYCGDVSQRRMFRYVETFRLRAPPSAQGDKIRQQETSNRRPPCRSVMKQQSSLIIFRFIVNNFTIKLYLCQS